MRVGVVGVRQGLCIGFSEWRRVRSVFAGVDRVLHLLLPWTSENMCEREQLHLEER